MAKKGKAAPNGDGIDAGILRSLVQKVTRLNSDLAESRGEIGAVVKDAEETHHIHRKAFKLACSLSTMDPTKRSDFLRSFGDYCEKLGFHDQLDLVDKANEARRAASAEPIGTEPATHTIQH